MNQQIINSTMTLENNRPKIMNGGPTKNPNSYWDKGSIDNTLTPRGKLKLLISCC